MAFDQETGKQDWNYRDYMRAKNEILEKYLKAWTQILWKFRRLLYVDCFAGKGKYDSEEYGSPIIALKDIEEILIKYPRILAYLLSLIQNKRMTLFSKYRIIVPSTFFVII